MPRQTETSNTTAGPDLTGLSSSEKILLLATSPTVPESFFDDVRRQYGEALMLEAYVEALFATDSILRRNPNFIGHIPAAVMAQGEALAERFMERLHSVKNQRPGLPPTMTVFLLTPAVQAPFERVLSHLKDPVAVAELHLGTRRGKIMTSGRILWRDHPVNEVREYFKASPPAPGELGPTLTPLLQLLDNGLPVRRSVAMIHMQSALAMVHHLAFNQPLYPAALLPDSLLILLGDKRYDQDLAYPVNEHSAVIDHIPRLMEHMTVLCDKKANALLHPQQTKEARQSMAGQLNWLQAQIDRNHERLVMGSATSLREPERETGRGGRPTGMEMDVL